MLPKLNRLTRKRDFDNVFKKGVVAYSKVIGLKIVDNKEGYNRFGVIVSTKVSKKAVMRNKTKRRIREVIKTELNKLVSGKDCVFITFPLIIDKEFNEIEKIIKTQFKKLRMYKNNK